MAPYIVVAEVAGTTTAPFGVYRTDMAQNWETRMSFLIVPFRLFTVRDYGQLA